MPLKAEIANAIYKGLYSWVLTKIFLGTGFEGNQVPYQNDRAFFILEGFGNKSPFSIPYIVFTKTVIFYIYL